MDSSDEYLVQRTRKSFPNKRHLPLWTKQSTDLLIKYRLMREDFFTNAAAAWKLVLSDMQKTEGFERFTVSYISKKWTNLCRIYKDCKKFLTTSEIPFSYYYIFDNYYISKEKKKNSQIVQEETDCRLCQQLKGVYLLQDDKDICTIIQECTSIDVSSDPENFPLKICILCKSKLDSINIFKNQCCKVDELLRNSTSKEEVKKQISSCIIILSNEESPALERSSTFSSLNTHNETSLKEHDIETKSEESKDLSEDVEMINVEPTLEEIFLEDEFRDDSPNDDDLREDTNEDGVVSDLVENIDDQEKPTDIKEEIVNIINAVSKKYTCVICMKEFVRPAELRRHEKYHVGIKHKCPRADCSKTYSSVASIRAHELRDHQGIIQYLCTLCGKGFIRPSSLKAHEKLHKGIKDFPCEFCEKSFYTRSNLYIHRRIYHLGYQHFCSQCPRSFVSKSSLDRHEVVHTGIKAFKCSTCESAFFTNRELDWHIRRIHKVEKKFNCGECFKSFHTKYALTVHTRIHTDERPYPCEWPNCQKRFRVSRKMRQHMKIHSK